MFWSWIIISVGCVSLWILNFRLEGWEKTHKIFRISGTPTGPVSLLRMAAFLRPYYFIEVLVSLNRLRVFFGRLSTVLAPWPTVMWCSVTTSTAYLAVYWTKSCGWMIGGSTPERSWESLSSPPCPDRFWDPLSLLSNG